MAISLLWFQPGTAQSSLPGKSGDLLVFATRTNEESDQPFYRSHIYELSLDGTTREFVAPNSNSWPALSPDRRKLAFVRNPGDQVWFGPTSDLGLARQISFPPPSSYADASQPVFAPDGKSIVYSNWVGNYPGVHVEELVRYWLESGRSYSSGDFSSVWPSPDISPDGSLFAFTVGSSESTSTIHLAMKFGTMGVQLDSPVPAFSPSFSPDGRKLAYLSPVDGIRQVFISRLNGSIRRQVTDEDASVYKVVFSPDATQIAYQVGGSDDTEIVVLNLKTDERQIVSFPLENVRLVLTEWPRVRLFRVLRFHPRRDRLRFRTFGRGTIVVRAGRRLLGKRKVRRSGKHSVYIRKRTRRFTRARVVFRPVGALPGKKRIWLRR